MTALPSERFGTSIMQRDINTLIRYLEGLSGGGSGGYPDRIENASSEGAQVDGDGSLIVTLGDKAGVEELIVKDSDGNVVWKVDSDGRVDAYYTHAIAFPGSGGGFTIKDGTEDIYRVYIINGGQAKIAAATGSALHLCVGGTDVAFLQGTSLYVGDGGEAELDASGNHTYQGDLKPYRNTTAYTGYVFVPLTTPLTSTSFDGDDRIDTQNGVVDLSSVFSAPAGIKAIACTLSVKCGTINKQVALGPSETYYYAIHQHTQVANQLVEISGTVPCDANGDVYFYTDAVEGGAMTVYWRIWGYYI